MARRDRQRDARWYRGAILYEVAVRSFFDSNDDGVGDFPGLLAKLDYIESLGVTCLWLPPFFASPLRDDGYDVSDYCQVHPGCGTIEDFTRFLDAAHARGLRVVIELVLNHTSDAHPWFQRAHTSPAGSVERDFYVWSETEDRFRALRPASADGERSNWSWDPEARAYYWHRFSHHEPDLNYDNPAVLQEMLKVLDFWLALGVDGFRLDAAPHAVLKAIRRHLDQRRPECVLAAEDDHSTADVRAYFGEGDECHMAYHYPLMRRIFSGLQRERRGPMVEAIRDTPPLPDGCQWALALRHHDDSPGDRDDAEGDDAYLAYSADPQRRLTMTLRRRLAPLVGNNRRRIELLNSLLFSLPGSPVVYYGDEIGMGDNVYLGERAGVRTPMQWTSDRNARFSRADPARLVSPVIMDPVYSYQAINVEAQERDASSLLQWMRNLIGLRKLFPAFGEGGLELLEPANDAILAYVRRLADDTILCVANLSRSVQPAELDLRAFEGCVPVEMLGYTRFPPVGSLPYFLTLGPYGFYWFELQRRHA